MANLTSLDSQISSVKVYAAGATVTRFAALNLNNNILPDQVELVGLPLALDDSSVRVRVEGGGAIATDIRVGLSVPHRSPSNLPDLEEKIRLAQSDVQQLETLLILIHNEITVLRQLTVPERPLAKTGHAPPPSPIHARLTLTNFKHEQIRDRLQEKRQVQENLRLAKEHLHDLRQKQQQASTAQEAKADELRKTIIVRLEQAATIQADTIQGDRPTPCSLQVEYFVPGARWTPTYVCRLNSKHNTAAIAVRALISQRTGEDWAGVKLELSTAAPQLWCELPELPSLRLGRAQAVLAKAAWRSPPVGAEQLFEDFDRQKISAAAALQFPQTDTQPLPVTVPALSPLITRFTTPEDLATAVAESPMLQELEDFIMLESVPMAAAESDRSLLGAAGSVPPDRRYQKTARSVSPPPPAPAAMMAAPQFYGATAPEPSYTYNLVGDRLTYGFMRLGNPNEPETRGKLQIESRGQAYLGTLKQQQVTVNFDVMEPIQQALDQAQQCLTQPLPPGGVMVRTVAGSFDYAYRADGQVDIPSDGQFHSVALTQQETDIELRYIVVPREDPHVFRIAQLRNPLQAPLISGPVDVYVDDEYVLSTSISTVPANGKMELGLGVEQAIKVARNTAFSEVRSGKILVAFNEFRHHIKVAIANNLPNPIQIEVRERLPVPQEGEKVEVEVQEVSPSWEKYEQEERGTPVKGGYRWRVQVPHQSQFTLSLQYTVKTYADSELVGGNRRE